MSEYKRWQDLHPPLPPTTQSERAQKSMLPPGYQNREQRRRRHKLHPPDFHALTRGKARTREIERCPCTCLERSKARQVVRKEARDAA